MSLRPTPDAYFTVRAAAGYLDGAAGKRLPRQEWRLTMFTALAMVGGTIFIWRVFKAPPPRHDLRLIAYLLLAILAGIIADYMY